MFRSSTPRLAAILAGAALFFASEQAVSASAAPQVRHPLLDVPYMSQTPALCGGAAVAMVLRYWGKRDVFPEDFAPLVASSEGILTSVLAGAVRDRGWQAFVVPATDGASRARIQSEIDRGRPLIALIEVAPRTYHYVVIVGATEREVILHDPARAPFRVLPWADFDRAWATAARWMMLVLPPDGVREDAARPAPPLSPVTAPAAMTPCAALVDRAVDMALGDDRESAEQALIAATRTCPNEPASWRELAGWRFSQKRWPEARDLALAAIRLDPKDAYAWQLVATSRYLIGDTTGALEAWNRTGDPRIDHIIIHGAERTRQPVVVRAAGLRPRELLTPGLFDRALRRLQDLPVVSSAHIKFEPLDGGLAKVDVFLDERRVAPTGWLPLAMLVSRALIQDELRVDIAGPLGAGELAALSWRWRPERPRVALVLAVPSPQWLPGIVSLEASWEQQAYRSAPSSPTTREGRRRVGFRMADWVTGWARWETGAAMDVMRTHDDVSARDFLALDGSLDVRLARDRLAVIASGGWWGSFAGHSPFGAGALRAVWRSTDRAAHSVWSASTGIQIASRAAPHALWPGAGTGRGRDTLLRAHPLLDAGVLTGPAFGRHLTHGSVEYARPVANTFGGAVSIAWFVDAAHASHQMSGASRPPLFVDAGIGVRVRAPGSSGVIRLDVAHGLRDGGTALSVGWGGAWPRQQ